MPLLGDELLAKIAALDRNLLSSMPGEERKAVVWLTARQTLVAKLTETSVSLAALVALQERTTQLGEKFLHWRRTSIMEMSFIEQNLRYLSAQTTNCAASGHKNVAFDA